MWGGAMSAHFELVVTLENGEDKRYTNVVRFEQGHPGVWVEFADGSGKPPLHIEGGRVSHAVAPKDE